MEALYAFLRHTDDLGDSSRPVAERRNAIAAWRQALADALSTEYPVLSTEYPVLSTQHPVLSTEYPVLSTQHPVLSTEYPVLSTQYSILGTPHSVLPALGDAVRRFRIPAGHLFLVLDGVEMDLDGRRYRTFAELTEYCDRVATAVGLACIHVWGFHGEGTGPPVLCCGRAFQLTNILRDLQEDAARGRVYLPEEDLDRFGYSSDDLARGIADERFDRLMAFQIDRVRRLYREGAALFDCLEPSGRRIFGMMFHTYWRLLEAVARRPRKVLLGRVRLSRWEKLRIATRWTLLPPRRPAIP